MKIVVLDGYTLNPGDISWGKLKDFGDVELYDRTPANLIVERCKGASIVLTNKTPLDKNTLKQLHDLKYIGVLATGYNVIDIDAAKDNGIVVSNVPGYGTASVVQMTFALLLELCQHVQNHSEAVLNGKWASAADWCFWDYPLIELSDKTIGIIGFGNIGQKLAEVATAFGMNVVASGRAQAYPYQSRKASARFEWRNISELLKESDIVSLHCPLTPGTTGLINKNSLSTMKPSAFLLNTSRGPLINDQDLADALNNDVIAGAGLDVLSIEPPSNNNPLLKAKNCIITPHIAWATKEARTRLMDLVVDNVAAFLNSKPLNVVNSCNPFVTTV
jgi:glycerate dehydrogenase